MDGEDDAWCDRELAGCSVVDELRNSALNAFTVPPPLKLRCSLSGKELFAKVGDGMKG